MNDRREANRTGWAQSGDLTPGSGQTANLQKAFEETGSYTVQFNVLGKDESATAGTRITRAQISWTVNGNLIHRFIDVVNGTSITGFADSVNVAVSDFSQGPISPYTVTIMVAKGSRPTTQQAPFLNAGNISLLAGAQTHTLKLPQDVGATCAFVTVVPSTPDGAIPEFDATVSHDSGQGSLKLYNPRAAQWVPLASGTTAITVSTGPAAPATLWSVTLGIDG